MCHRLEIIIRKKKCVDILFVTHIGVSQFPFYFLDILSVGEATPSSPTEVVSCPGDPASSVFSKDLAYRAARD